MKKWLCIVAWALCLCGFAQGKFTVTSSLDAKEDIFKTGSTIPVRITYTCPPDYELKAWNVSVYAKNAPSSFGKVMKLKVRGKNPQWQGYSFHSWKWMGNMKSPLKVSFSTKGFPEGDYRFSISTLFRKKGQRGGKADRYISNLVSLSLEK